jgi:hypothetical protein
VGGEQKVAPPANDEKPGSNQQKQQPKSAGTNKSHQNKP